jgi:hypothetical protein
VGRGAVETERLSPGSRLPPGEAELWIVAHRAYKAGRELTHEQRGLVLRKLQRDLGVLLRTGPTWWSWETDWVSHDRVLTWARGEGWRIPEVDAVLAHFRICGDVEQRRGASQGGLSSPEWRWVTR